MGLGINHFVNIVTNMFTPNPYPVPVESLGIHGTPQGYMGECETLHLTDRDTPEENLSEMTHLSSFQLLSKSMHTHKVIEWHILWMLYMSMLNGPYISECRGAWGEIIMHVVYYSCHYPYSSHCLPVDLGKFLADLPYLEFLLKQGYVNLVLKKSVFRKVTYWM